MIKIVLLAQSKLNSIKLISKSLMNLNITHDEFISINKAERIKTLF